MSRLLRHVFLFALCLGCPGFLSDANSQTQNPKKPRPASVSGRVTLHGKGAGGIVVGVRASDFSMSPAARSTTDSDGNYRITEIQPGRYQVALLSSAYTFSSEDLAGVRTKNLLLEEGEDVSGVDFSVVRGGVITGRITDADGRPVIEERITLFSEPTVQANLNLKFQIFNPNNPVSMQTDDRGVYRIYGLPSGRYKIAAGLAENNNYSSFGGRRATYKQTFFPDAARVDDATIIELAEDAEARNIDITLGRMLPGFIASGKIVDRETNQPVVGARLAARRVVGNNQSASLGIPAPSDSQGSFRLDNLTPGKYSIIIVPQPGIEVRVESATLFEVVDQNVTGLLVQTVKGLTVTGAVVLDGDYDRNIFEKLAQLRLSAYVRSAGNPFLGRETTLSSDGSFRIGGLSSGMLNFSISQQDRREAVGFSILRVERDGVAQPRGIEIKEEQVSGVKIVVGYGTGSVRGELKFENGPLQANGRAVVSLRKPSVRGGFRQYSPDLRGHFLIEGVRAGTYDLYVNVFLGEGRPLETKQAVTVSEGAASDVVVSVDLKPNQEPTPQ